MARFHFWGFIVNEAGEPIENANVSVKLANTDTLACLYLDEYSAYNTCDDPNVSPSAAQLQTLENGYYEFWISDTSETHGYRYDQKFKIEWERVGIAHGMVDNVNILPMSDQVFPANTSICTAPSGSLSTDMNKLVSDALVCGWERHRRGLTETGETPHGLEYVDVTRTDSKRNKIISNDLGWKWDTHVDSTIQVFNPSAGPPHGLQEVDLNSVDPLRNKVVSNKDMHELYIQMLRSYEVKIYGYDWINYYSGELWYFDITHNLDAYYPHVTCYNDLTHEIERMATIEYRDKNTIRIIVNSENPPIRPIIEVWVKISG